SSKKLYAYSKVPTRIKLDAVRVKTADSSTYRRTIFSLPPTTAKLLEVGIFNANIASLIKYSRNIDDKVPLPSPRREKGVRPEPFSCISTVFTLVENSPKSKARPSPSMLKCPNCCPA